MAQQLTIKQIAEMAGVSTGTVDRILHNRGKVSPEAMAAVQEVLSTQSYKYNLHTSAVAFKKTKKSLRLIITIPSSEKGEYWDLIRKGIEKGLNEYGDFDIDTQYRFFDQFSSLSCRTVFEGIARENCSAVIIGTTYAEETASLCSNLTSRHIPYIFVDGNVHGTNPVASFKADQLSCGRLMARLMDGFTPQGKELALLLPRRAGTQISNNSEIRMASFKAYFTDNGKDRTVREAQFSTGSPQEAHSEVQAFLLKNPEIGGIAVVTSNSYLVADAVEAAGIKDVVVGGFDVTNGNARCLKAGTLIFLINQHPQQQGFSAVECMLHYVLYRTADGSLSEDLPIGIVFPENLDFWQED